MSSIMRKSVDNVNHMASLPSAPSPAEAVIELVHGVMHQFRSRQYQVLRDGAHDVTHMESKVMAFFSHHPDATLSDLVAHSGRDKAQLAKLVKGLRERALLLGEPDPDDRRSLRLSDAGRAVQRALRAEAQALNTRAIDGLDAAEQAQLIALLARLKANLDAADGD
jgi:DNA-binding MarR family transcriptional regulator